MRLKVMEVLIMLKILNSFNHELQLKNIESIKNKVTELLNQLKGFKFVTTLVLEFKKIDDSTKYDNFIWTQKAKKIISESDIDDVFESIETKLYKPYKKF